MSSNLSLIELSRILEAYPALSDLLGVIVERDQQAEVIKQLKRELRGKPAPAAVDETKQLQKQVKQLQKQLNKEGADAAEMEALLELVYLAVAVPFSTDGNLSNELSTALQKVVTWHEGEKKPAKKEKKDAPEAAEEPAASE